MEQESGHVIFIVLTMQYNGSSRSLTVSLNIVRSYSTQFIVPLPNEETFH